MTFAVSDGGAAADAEDREEAGQAVQEAPYRPLQVPQGRKSIFRRLEPCCPKPLFCVLAIR